MRGFPPLHVLAFVVAFALLAIPLSRLTFARVDETPRQPVGERKTESKKVATLIRVRMAHLPSSLSLTVDGAELLPPDQQKPQELELSFETPLAISADGLEIFTKATWPEGTPSTALTIDVEPQEENHDARTQTNWSLGTELKSAYLFQWKP